MDKSACALKFLAMLLAIAGLLPVVNPARKLSNLKASACNIFAVLAVFQLLYPFVELFDVIYNNSSDYLAGSKDISKKILYYTVSMSAVFINGIIRLNALLSCGKTLQLCGNIAEATKSVAEFGLGRGRESLCGKRAAFLIALLIGVAVAFIRDVVSNVIYIRDPTGLNFTAVTIPADLSTRRALLLFYSISMDIAAVYAISFVIIMGVQILEVHDGLHRVLSEAVSAEGYSAVASVEQGDAPEALRDRGYYEKTYGLLKLTKRVGDEYEQIAGWYLVTLLAMGLINGIEALSFLMLDGVHVGNNVESFVEANFIVLLLAFFGEHFGNSVSRILYYI